jgi:hypothetical protein
MAIPNSLTTVGIPSASGYTVFSGLIHPVYSKTFVKRLYAETVSGMITDQSVVPTELRTSGDVAIMRRAPRGELFRYSKNQALDHSTFNSSTFTFKVDKAWYWNLKLDELDFKQISEVGEWIKAFQDDSIEQLGAQIDHDVIHDMVVSTHACNKGAKAGVRSHMYNLGKVGAPLQITTGGTVNPLTVLVQMLATLGEQNLNTSNKMFAVLPQAMQPLFIANPILSNACMSGMGKSTLLTGTVVDNVAGVKLIFTPNMPSYVDPVTGDTCYPIVMGLKSATGFVNQLTKTQIIDQDPRSFSRYWRGLQLSGWGVLRPEYLASAYVTLSPIY